MSWFAIYNVAVNTAERVLDAGTTAMLIQIGPILVAILAGTFLREGLPRWLLIGALVSLGGVVVIAMAPARTGPLDAGGARRCACWRR